MKLDKNISDLLHEYDCVIVPELGGFVTNYSPAQLDERSSVFSPPYKAISFNSYLKKNDGLLANYIADKHQLTFKQANKKIKKKVEAYFTKLNNGERVIFDNVGILYMDESKKLQFSPDTSTNYLIESFGLRKVYAHAIEPEKVVVGESKSTIKEVATKKPIPKEAILIPLTKHTIAKPPTEKVVETIPAEEHSSSRRWLWRAAAIVLPIAIGSYFLYNPNGNSNLNLSNLNPLNNSIGQTYHVRKSSFTAPDIPLSTDFPDLFEIPSDKQVFLFSLTDIEGDEIPVRVKPTPESALKNELTAGTNINSKNVYFAPKETSSLNYHVVAGCFGNLKNAERKVRRIRKKGFDAFIIDLHKGLYRVAYGSYNQRNKALILLQAVKQNEDQSAWLMRK